MTQAPINERGEALGRYIADSQQQRHPDEVLHEARRALVDYLGLALVAAHDPVVVPLRGTVRRWQARGKARVVLGGTTTPALAALVNGTAVHAMDYDDVHYLGAGHPGAPCWSTALAVGQEHEQDEQRVLAAFVTGVEIMARLGGGFVPGVGRSLQRKGFHPTSVVGRMGAAAVAASLYGLDAARSLHALSNAATTAGGLVASFGTHGKPFHAGKAAMDGILAADLAAEGYIGANHAFELQGGWLDAFIQDRQVEVPPLDFADHYELLRNGYKLFASCRATHASAQTAQALVEALAGREVKRVQVKVHPGALVTAGKTAPATGLEAKFSVACCVAMALSGYRLAWTDFVDATLADARVQALLPRIEIVPVAGQSPASAHVKVELADDDVLQASTSVILGHPDNPVSDAGLTEKFRALAEPVIGVTAAAALLDAAWRFGATGTLARIDTLLKGEE
ncbi:MmgE/PrpD family protein [Bordetella sp. N]|uniref:MmgE/PrpD family protein n=1 Tax=Bordetella sp. N TaxID=1746199 RepID=UPI00070A2BBC|nr:MmgE/PrpD family protein [Bordetella sp. N]ALM82257.1 2-methylcitrate dehydratase [Bordetella sp. N]